MRQTIFSAVVCVGFALIVLYGVISLSGKNNRSLEGGICHDRIFEGSAFTVCRVNALSQAVQLVLTDKTGQPLRNFAALAAQLGTNTKDIRFAMNAGMFHEGGIPVGLHVEQAVEKYPLNTDSNNDKSSIGNFFLQPNGVFSIDADKRFHIETTAAYRARKAQPAWATQSGPMLVIDGKQNPAFQADGKSKHLRNGVGLSGPTTAFFVISNTPVSFGRFARFFQNELRCGNALYFDGAISSLWLPSKNRMDNRYELGPIIVVR
jgi:uncharacterized protein YigE (DUF2233 family)